MSVTSREQELLDAIVSMETLAAIVKLTLEARGLDRLAFAVEELDGTLTLGQTLDAILRHAKRARGGSEEEPEPCTS